MLTDTVECGPVTLSLPQDVQAEAYDFPESFFEPRNHSLHRAGPDADELSAARIALCNSKRPLLVAGGGVHYSSASDVLAEFCSRLGIPAAETQAGKGTLPWGHECNVGAIGVTGSSAANVLASEADLIVAVGTRLQDFTTGSGLLISGNGPPILSINVARHDLGKRGAIPLRGDARICLEMLDRELPRITGRHRVAGESSPVAQRLEFGGRQCDFSRRVDAAIRRRGARRRQPYIFTRLNGRLRCRRPAWRIAQALASQRQRCLSR